MKNNKLTIIVTLVVLAVLVTLGTLFSVSDYNPGLPLIKNQVGESFKADDLEYVQYSFTGCSLDNSCIVELYFNDVRIDEFMLNSCSDQDSDLVDPPSHYDLHTREGTVDVSELSREVNDWYFTGCKHYEESAIMTAVERVECTNNNHCIDETRLLQGQCMNNICEYDQTTSVENKSTNLIILVLVVVIMLILAVAIYFFMRDKK